jgi:DNA-binding SARP family transcriptional activator
MDSPRHVRLRLLTSFDLVDLAGRTAVPLSPQRLVAFVALGARPQTRASVACRLWPDMPEDRASALLRTALWQLRRRAPGLLCSNGTHVWLDADVDVDLYRARGLAGRLAACDGSVPTDADALYEDLLPEWPDEWVLVERERYRQVRLHALERLSRALRARGDVARAIDVALAVVAADPLRETGQRALIESHLAEGNVSEAVRHFRVYAALLEESLGIGPSGELAALLPRCRTSQRSERDPVPRARLVR